MIRVVCSPEVKPAHVLELAGNFEAVCTKDITLEVCGSGKDITARADGAVFSAHDEVAGRAAKLAAYRALKAATGISLDWGCLTGVKPLKILQKLISGGMTYGEACAEMTAEYEISPQKCALLRAAAENQRALLYPQGKKAALYINVPLCPSKCAYCSFPSAVTAEGSALTQQYLDALMYELEAVDAFARERFAYDTVYIGGGTPSILSARQIARLLEMIARIAPDSAECTFEAGRCDTLDNEKLSALKAGGVSRISLNPQTMHDATLRGVGRGAYCGDFQKIYAQARGRGFKNINCDLIIGFAHETEADILYSLHEVLRLSPESISLHALCKKRTSETSREEIFATDVNVSALQDKMRGILKKEGYFPYYLYRQKYAVGAAENIGYARAGAACVYNIRMMGETQSVFSAGAHATTKIYFPQTDIFKSVYMPKELSLYMTETQRLTQKKLDNMKNIAASGRL